MRIFENHLLLYVIIVASSKIWRRKSQFAYISGAPLRIAHVLSTAYCYLFIFLNYHAYIHPWRKLKKERKASYCKHYYINFILIYSESHTKSMKGQPLLQVFWYIIWSSSRLALRDYMWVSLVFGKFFKESSCRFVW